MEGEEPQQHQEEPQQDQETRPSPEEAYQRAEETHHHHHVKRVRRVKKKKIRKHRHHHRDPRRRSRFLVLASFILGIGVLVATDMKWEWRDSLRRMLEGEDEPAFRAAEWHDARGVCDTLRQRLEAVDFDPDLGNRETRRDLALHTLVSAAGPGVISRGGPEMRQLMETLGTDVEWLEEIVYGVPLDNAEQGLKNLAFLCKSEGESFSMVPERRRLATALAFECARAGLDENATWARYRVFSEAWLQLNSSFAKLTPWEMSILAARTTVPDWGAVPMLHWFQENIRLPESEYVHAADQLKERKTTLFGVSVNSNQFRILYADATDSGIANLYKDSGCSTPEARAAYAAAAACSHGVPSVVVSWKGDASRDEGATCMVHAQGQWISGVPIPGDATCSWSVWGQNHPDFVRLVTALGSDGEAERSIKSSRLARLGSFALESGDTRRALSFLRAAIKAQPLNYPAWAALRKAGADETEMSAADTIFADYPGVRDTLH